MKELITKLKEEHTLSKEEWTSLISNRTPELSEYLFHEARLAREPYYGNRVFIRGLIEFTNYCKNDCFYCGIRKSNQNACRYRLSKKEILDCCHAGYDLGFRTFVLQGGEDGFYSDDKLIDLIASIKHAFHDCALTLSIGEKSYESYKTFFDAGADRYLLRHETADSKHYRSLHPETLSPEKRKQCLFDLKEIGYQVGTGFMVGSPGQTASHLAEDMIFIKNLNPQMIGIGPFIPHHDTRYKYEAAGTLELTLFMLGLLRLMLPNVLLPATTALGTISPNGRELGMNAGANVVMPNLSPKTVREHYSLYDNKLHTGGEAAESLRLLKEQMASAGYKVVIDRGDSLNM